MRAPASTALPCAPGDAERDLLNPIRQLLAKALVKDMVLTGEMRQPQDPGPSTSNDQPVCQEPPGQVSQAWFLLLAAIDRVGQKQHLSLRFWASISWVVPPFLSCDLAAACQSGRLRLQQA